MSACPDRAMLLQALLDGELDAANTLASETHLKTCDACHAAFLQLQALRETIAGSGLRHAAPERLRGAVETALAAEGAPVRTRPVRRIGAWAAGGGIGAVAAGLAVLLLLPQLTAGGVERQLVASHVRSLLADHLTDVQTSDQHVVRPWFNGKVDIAPPVPDLAAAGFPLAGGRLDYIEGRVVPALVYHRRLHTVNLFVWPDDGVLPAADRTAQRDGYNVVSWTRGGLRFSAVSDIDPQELQQFRLAFAGHTPG